MFNSRTKKIFIFSLLILSITISIFGFLVYKIHTQGNQLEDYLVVINERNAQESSFIKVRKLIQETEEDRNVVNSAFFKDESESINFLGDIEKMAKASSIQLTTESLDKTIDTDKVTEYIKIVFIFKGKKTDVLNFTKLLETVPYHSWVESLDLSKDSNNIWEGRLTLFITIQPS